MTHGSMISIQIRHLGQKGSTWRLFLGFGRIAGWSDGTASGVQATELPILPLILISGLENLKENTFIRVLVLSQASDSLFPTPTWKEHIRVSSTLIMAPALSNSPQ